MNYQPTRTTCRNDSPVANLLEMVSRGCKRLMIEGGGPLPCDHATDGWRNAVYMTPEQRANAVEIGKKGQLTSTEIARKLGVRQSSIRRLMQREGIKVPIGNGKAQRMRLEVV